MVGAIEPAEDLFDHLFPGKSAEEAAVLGLQAMGLAMLASARRIDHLHAHFTSNATTVALLAARISAIPYSFTAHARDIYHTYVNGRVDAALRRRKIAEARFVVTVSDYNQRHLAALAGAATSSKIRRIYNGIDLGRFAPGERPVTAKPCRFLAVGRLVEKKGFTYLIEACRLLHAKGVPFRCELVGEGPLRDALLSQVRAAGLDEIVTLHGAMPQESLLELMHSSSVVVLPAIVTPSGDRDALPTVLLEGLAMGLPAVSTDVSGITEIVEHGSSGLVVPPEDAPALAQAMQQVAVDGALRSRLGANGRRRARERFDLVRNVNELRQCFERSAGGNSVVEMTTAREEQGHAHRVPVCG